MFPSNYAWSLLTSAVVLVLLIILGFFVICLFKLVCIKCNPGIQTVESRSELTSNEITRSSTPPPSYFVAVQNFKENNFSTNSPPPSYHIAILSPPCYAN